MRKKVYHVTTSRRAARIEREGINKQFRKNVRISKKNMIYVFGDLLNAGTFASEMNWKLQKPVSIIEAKVEKSKLKPDTNPFFHANALMIGENIKPNQITKIIPVDNKFWKQHMRRMNKLYKK